MLTPLPPWKQHRYLLKHFTTIKRGVYKYCGIRYTQYVSSLNGQWGWSCQNPPSPLLQVSHQEEWTSCSLQWCFSWSLITQAVFFLPTSPVSCEIVFLFWLVFCPVSLSGLSPEPHCLTHCSLGTIMLLAHMSCPVSSSSMTFNLRATSPCRVRLCLLDLYSTACHIILTKKKISAVRCCGLYAVFIFPHFSTLWCRCEHAYHLKS